MLLEKRWFQNTNQARPPDEQIQRLVIDTIMRQWPSKQSLQYINRFMRNEGKKEIKPRTFQTNQTLHERAPIRSTI